MKLKFPAVIALLLLSPLSPLPGAEPLPNVILILADDLGYGDLGCYGQKLIQTPNLDRLAAEGIRFTQFYAGSTVCAPSRCVLMTGKHTGRCWVRGNAGRGNASAQTLRAEDRTIAEIFKSAGYRTAQFGKWGLGEADTPGHPNQQGFDEFFGYLNQRHAHNYYTTFLYRNSEKVPLRNVPEKETPGEGDGWAKEKLEYSHDRIVAESFAWLERHHDRPFFLYLPVTIPHANNEAAQGVGNGQEVPDYGIYSGKDWPEPDKGQAAMITRLDRDLGRWLEKLNNLGIDEQTLVLFSSDNGPHKEGRNRPEFFDANGPLRGLKRSLYEGGIRVPMIARWPGKIAPGTVSDHVGYFGDLMATVCELTGQQAPGDIQSLSFLPALLSRNSDQRRHDFLYWEFYEQGSRQAVRFGNWKAIREPMIHGRVELYDLSRDLGEMADVSANHSEIIHQAIQFMNTAHVPDPKWQPSGNSGKAGKAAEAPAPGPQKSAQAAEPDRLEEPPAAAGADSATALKPQRPDPEMTEEPSARSWMAALR